jgi:hypothetical protein
MLATVTLSFCSLRRISSRRNEAAGDRRDTGGPGVCANVSDAVILNASIRLDPKERIIAVTRKNSVI